MLMYIILASAYTPAIFHRPLNERHILVYMYTKTLIDLYLCNSDNYFVRQGMIT